MTTPLSIDDDAQSSQTLPSIKMDCRIISRQLTDTVHNDTPQTEAFTTEYDNPFDGLSTLGLPPLIARQRTNAAPKGPIRMSTISDKDKEKSSSPDITALNELTLSGLQRQITDEIQHKDSKEESAFGALPQMDDISRQRTDAAHDDDIQMMMDPMPYLPPRVIDDSDMNNPFLDSNLLMFDDKGKLLEDNEAFVLLNKEDDSLNQFIEHNEAIICIAFNPQKEYEICSGSQDEHCYIWNILQYDPSDENKEMIMTADHSDTIVDCGWNVSGKYMATASMDCCIKIYNCHKNYKLISSLDIGEEISYIKWNPNKKNVLMAGGLDKNVWIYQYNKIEKTFESIQILSGHSAKIECGGFTKYNNGKYGYSGDQDGVIIIWDNVIDSLPFKGHKKCLFKPNKDNITLYHESGINVLDDCLMAPLLISGSSDHSVCLINYENGKIIQKLGKHLDSVECVKFNKLYSHYSSSSSLDGFIKIWDLNKAKIRSELKHNDGVIVHEWFNTESNANLIVSGGMDGVVYLWDIRCPKKVKQFKGHQKCSIQTIKISSDDKYVVSGADDSIAMVWKI